MPKKCVRYKISKLALLFPRESIPTTSTSMGLLELWSMTMNRIEVCFLTQSLPYVDHSSFQVDAFLLLRSLGRRGSVDWQIAPAQS